MTFEERLRESEGGKYYTTSQFAEFMSAVMEDYGEKKFPKSRTITSKRTGETKQYLELACSFDIETTNYTNSAGKDHAAMYIWMFGIGGAVIVGRTWDEFVVLLQLISAAFGLNDVKRIVVYCHNLSFEYQFIRRHFQWKHLFARATREPLYTVNEYGFEFRDSLALTNMSLSLVGKTLHKYKVLKRDGDLDYTKIRNAYTELTPEEMGYCINDVLVVMALITERMESDKGIEGIPLTQTGYPRRYCRNKCLPANRKYPYYNYKKTIEKLTLTPFEYCMVKNAFQGGFTHANPWYVGKTVEDVTSYDFTSSYPAVLCFEKYPMSKGMIVDTRDMTSEQFAKLLKQYGAVMTITFRGLDSKSTNEFYLSSYKCLEECNVQESNGRIVSADMVKITITSIDFEIVLKTYNFASFVVNDLIVYRMNYLPTPFIRTVLDLYADKTTLKSVPGREEEYQRKKEMLNALYGMTSQDVCRPIVTYDDDWDEKEADIEQSVKDYNDDESRFLSYLWGCFCTAHARKRLWSGIRACGPDYVYSDTDSIKIRHAERHKDYIEQYNEDVIKRAMYVCALRNIPFTLCVPSTVDGTVKPLGVWDYDGHYDKFKTLGAKRYMVEEKGKLSLTVSGVDKKSAIPYLQEKYGDKVFDAFRDGLYIPPGKSGKMIAKYIDEEFEEELVDYQGHKAIVSEKSCVHIADGDYTLGISGVFKEYLKQLTSGFVELPSVYRLH